MAWNYRVILFKNEAESCLAIHEVYYDDEGRPNGYAVNPACVIWDEDEGQHTGAAILEGMQKALAKPVLKPEDFYPSKAG